MSNTDTIEQGRETQAEPKKQTRRVQFATSTTVRIVPRQTDEGASAVWYSGEDYQDMRSTVKKTVKAMRRNKLSDADDELCARGLEHLRSTMHLEQQVINKDCVVEAVLLEQERQFRSGVHDDVGLSNASMISSRWARDAARKIAASDAASVEVDMMTPGYPDMTCRDVGAEPRRSSFKKDSRLSNLERSVKVAAFGKSRCDEKEKEDSRLKRVRQSPPSWLDHQDSLLNVNLMNSVYPSSKNPSTGER